MSEEQKREVHWASVRAAVRRLSNDPDFQKFIEEIEYISSLARARSYMQEVKADHSLLLEETVIQETLENILYICDQGKGSVIEPDDELGEALKEPE